MKIRVAGNGVAPCLWRAVRDKLPNASNESGLGLDTTDFFASLVGAKTVQSIRVVGNIGLGILGDPTRGDRQNDVPTHGPLARAVTQPAELVAEINGHLDTREGAAPGNRVARAVRLGARYTIGGWRADAAILLGITQPIQASGSAPASSTCSTRSRSPDAGRSSRQGARAWERLRACRPQMCMPACKDSRAPMCHRHHGIGADGVLVDELRDAGATMRLLNADGSVSELSGNGMRAVWPRWSHERSRCTREPPSQSTPMPGRRRLEMLSHDRERYTFRASMGQPVDLRETSITVAGDGNGLGAAE